MESIVSSAIRDAQNSGIAFSKFITPNDTGSTGGHQAGFHIHKNAWRLFLDEPGEKGINKDLFVTIRWQETFETDSRFIYYGVGTRNEYRLTRFGRGFPFLNDDCVGDLLIICKIDARYYKAYVLQSDEDIEDFFAALNISSSDTNKLIPRQFAETAEDQLLKCFDRFIENLGVEFPSTGQLSLTARNCFNSAYNVSGAFVKEQPDKSLLNWLDAEFQLFKLIERNRYENRIKSPFKTVEELIEVANTILNRRKSRAGKSLEHHLSEIFVNFKLSFSSQAITEGNKKPDFIFPSIESYHNKNFNSDRLTMLASKTTCKDRWRQILNEADRINTKHLFTLQQGISINQLSEMYSHNVCLVVPSLYLGSFPKQFQSQILTLEAFINRLSDRMLS